METDQAHLTLSDTWHDDPGVPKDRYVTPEEMVDARRAAILAMNGVHEALAKGLITNVKVSFEIVSRVPDGENLSFDYSFPRAPGANNEQE